MVPWDSIRRLVVGERLEPNVQSACQLSKRSPFVFVCWCKHVAKERSLSRHEQVLERNRLRFNAGRRGGLQVVHMLSADSRPAQFESLLKVAPAGRPSAQFDSAVRESDAKPNATATKPAESRGAAGWNGHLAHGKSNGVPSGSSGHELRSSTVRKTIPRRPSPARMAANRVEFSVLFVLIAFFSFVYIFH
ncbi:hypothetical protein M3Y99_00451000 [Aphelenchoides fujianensis]|nr:hypothetical protein M3Y99_00451000 [Aphelenchoides fujianensis]